MNDVALLKIETEGLQTVTIGDSDEIEVGEIVEASSRSIPIYHFNGPITLTIARDGKDPNRWSWHI